MPSTMQTQEESETEHPAGAQRGAGYGRYLLLVLLLPALLFVGALLLARTDCFLHTSKRTLWIAMAYHMDEEAGQNCQVVIFGDSTGMIGLDPRALEARTGWKTCNLSIPYMAVSASGTMVLDHYLAENRPPKFIVFANHITHQRPPAFDEDDGVIDGWWFADRYFSPLRAIDFFVRHPRETYLFVAEVWQSLFSPTAVTRPDPTQRTYRNTMIQLHKQDGFYTMNYHVDESMICHPGYPTLRADAAYVDALRRKYQSSQTRVVFYVSPVPECDPDVGAYNALARRAGVPPPLALPEAEFADPHHLDAAGAEENTAVLARELLQMAGSNRKQ
jgi:hypothetical protein